MTLDAMAVICRSLNAELFGGRLPTPRLKWHDDGHCWGTIIARNACDRRPTIISIHRELETEALHDIVGTLVHELAHLATQRELYHHGPRWRRVMRERCGINPETEAINPNGPVARWLRRFG